MNHKLTCVTQSHSSTCEIEIQSGLLTDPNALYQRLKGLGSRFALISDDKVAKLYGHSLLEILNKSGLETTLFTFPNGEKNKTRSTKELLENQLFEKGLGKDSCVLAIGGGVATDIGGYIAATYCRGIPLVMVPTSLLGMVDASIGGKTGVNVPYGKNMIGCIYQPKRVLIDPSCLRSLPLNEVRNGIAEMIKHGLIVDANYFDFLNKEAEQLLKLDLSVLEKAIYDSCRIKKEIVEKDEREGGLRNLLNLGHTIGHAIETLTQYTISHGEAVAIGTLVESHLAVRLGVLSQSSFSKIQDTLTKFQFPLQTPGRLTVDNMMETMILDKKSRKGRPRFVILNNIGSALPYNGAYCTHVEPDLIKNSLQWMNDALRSH